jgi:hypothetical protein
MTRRVIQVDKNLYFEYEACSHQRVQKGIDSVYANRPSPEELPLEGTEQRANNDVPLEPRIVTGMHVPFKQVRLKGQINPLKPPIHVETVLIGRALEQRTGYLFGVGFRIRDDGYVEGEFLDGTEQFESFREFYDALRTRMQRFRNLGR